MKNLGLNNHLLKQHTLKQSISFIGVGLHSGTTARLSILPAAPDTGYVFVRRDVPSSKAQVRASWYNVTDTHLSTTISNIQGTSVATIEHVMAALYACNVDNAILSIDGPEVPCLDGSSQPFVDLIQQVGLVRQNRMRRVLVVEKTVTVRDGNRVASFEPCPIPWIEMEINFDNPVIGNQRLSKSVDQATFVRELASARTFGFENQLATLRDLGFARGGSLKNAILISDNSVINKEGLRYANEFVRHKTLDAIGDMALAGCRIIGQFNGVCTGHHLNNRLLHELMADKKAWSFMTMNEARRYWNSRLDSSSKESKTANS